MGVRDLSQPLRTGERRGYGMSLTVVFLSAILLVSPFSPSSRQLRFASPRTPRAWSCHLLVALRESRTGCKTERAACSNQVGWHLDQHEEG